MIDNSLKITALAGGVGGSRLAFGLAAHLPPENLKIIVNTGDDFVFNGLHISPDVDTVMYIMAGIDHPINGWGIRDDSHNCIEQMNIYRQDAWFKVGDRDFATHITRTNLLSEGMRLTEVTRRLAASLGIEHAILPMSDDPVRTMIRTEDGELDFQTWFVREKWQPEMKGLRWEGLETARPTPEVLKAIKESDLVIICPSNPFVSIDPILILPGLKPLILEKTVLAMSPIIQSSAIKGPAAKLFTEIGMEPSSLSVAKYYQGLINGLIIDQLDAGLREEIENLGIKTDCFDTLMINPQKRIEIGKKVLAFANQLNAMEHQD